MKKETISAAEKKRIEALDRKIEKLQLRVARKHKELEVLSDELMELIYERHPERKTEHIKEVLYESFLESKRPLDEVIKSIENPYPDED